MEKAPALDPMPPYEPCMVAFYRGAPAPGAPVVPTPLHACVMRERKCVIVMSGKTGYSQYIGWGMVWQKIGMGLTYCQVASRLR